MHPSGLPNGDGAHTCGACAWLDGSVCRFAEHAPRLAADTPGCAFWEPPVECDPCGACCREAFDSVPVTDEDQARLAGHTELIREHDDGWRDLHRAPSRSGCGTRCIALRGDGDGAPFRCIVYDRRPDNCRDLARGSDACLTARRRVGLTPWRPGQTPDGPWRDRT